jgi:predicted aldo/keto reductase-like oxidoreductase
LLSEAFDELDIESLEALGACCMLIRQKPAEWDDRVKKYIDARVQKTPRNVVKYFLLEALYREYYFKALRPGVASVVEQLLAYLLRKAGFDSQRTQKIIESFEKGRAQVQFVNRELQR